MEAKYQLKKPEYIKSKKRIGRGPGSGHGKTSCRGQKGQKSRSGVSKRYWFEGGQMPLQRRIPKRGFNNTRFRITYQVVNLERITKLELSEVTPQILQDNKLIRNSKELIKILGKTEISKSVKITADAFSSSALEVIKKSGGEAIIRK